MARFAPIFLTINLAFCRYTTVHFKMTTNINFPVLLSDRSNILSSTLDGNVEFVHSQYSIAVFLGFFKCQQFYVSEKIIDNIVIIKYLSYSEISAILCSIFYCFYTFLYNLGKHVN